MTGKGEGWCQSFHAMWHHAPILLLGKHCSWLIWLFGLSVSPASFALRKSIIPEKLSIKKPTPTLDASLLSLSTMSSVASVGSGTAVANDPLTPLIIEAFEKLDKWKGCLLDAAPSRMVFEHNRKRAAGNGFPSSI